jgi:hypothetical protein
LEREAQGEEVVIPLEDGTTQRFPQAALLEAFSHEVDRLVRRHSEAPHPLTVAMTRSSDPTLRNSGFASLTGVDEDGNIRPAPESVPDLSER